MQSDPEEGGSSSEKNPFKSASFLISSILPLAFILAILIFSCDLFQKRIINASSKSKRWGYLFQEFITQSDIDAMKREELQERQATSTVGIAAPRDSEEEDEEGVLQNLDSSNHEDSTLNDESSPLLGRNKSSISIDPPLSRPSWEATLGLVLAPVIELAGWTLVLAYQIIDGQGYFTICMSVAALLCWSYALYRPIFLPRPTAEYTLLVIYLIQLMGSLFSVHDQGLSFKNFNSIGLLLQVFNFFICAFAVAIIFRMPLEVHNEPPTGDEEGHAPPMEDYCTLWSWVTFNWMNGLLYQGAIRVLEEKDVWSLSSHLRSRLLLQKFLSIAPPIEPATPNVNLNQSTSVHDSSVQDGAGEDRSKHQPKWSLLYILFRANAKDMILDFVLTLLSSLLAYASPFFLNRILTTIADSETSSISPSSDSWTAQITSPSKRTAYLYAVLAFGSAVLKSQSDLQHLYYGRRASTRIRAELIASIYEKALRKKDIKGTIGGNRNEKAIVPESNSPVAAGLSTPHATSAALKADAKKKISKDEGESEAAADIGKIVSLMAVDAQRVGMQVAGLYMSYSAPLDLIVATFFLIHLLGKSAFAGYIAILLAAPIQSVLTRRLIKLSKSLASARDKRMSVLSEVISGLKFLKFFGQAQQWSEKVLASREVELSWLWKRYIFSSLLQLSWTLSPALFTFLSLASYTYIQGNELDAATAFTSLLVFNLVRQPMNILPMQLNEILNTYVSVQRIQKFLEEEDVPDWVSTLPKKTSIKSNSITKIEDLPFGCENATFTWTRNKPKELKEAKSLSPASFLSRIFTKLKFWEKKQSSSSETQRLLSETDSPPDDQENQEEDVNNPPFQLKDLTISFPRGRMTLIAGSTSSGKSSLLNALLGEMDLEKGNVHLPKDPSFTDPQTGLTGAVAYCPQQPWLQQCSIRDNILFGAPFEAQRYNQVLEAAALRPDLLILESGDATEIGEKGVSLSGGQKARVALARALYSRASTVLMDDVLSALDANTSEKVFREALQGPLMKDRTLVIVTHHVELVLPACSWVVLLQDGFIEAQGTVEELRSKGSLEAASSHPFSLEEEKKGGQEAGDPVPGDVQTDANTKTARQFVEEEKKAQGSVKLAVYRRYLKASSYTAMAIVVSLLLLFKMSDLLEKFWLSFWTRSYPTSFVFLSPSLSSSSSPINRYSFISHSHWNDPIAFLQVPSTIFQSNSSLHSFKSNFLNFPSASDNVLPYVAVLLFIELIGALIWATLAIIGYWASVRGGRVLFSQMLSVVARSTSRWLDRTPTGRLLNRFGKDIETIDSSIQGSLRQVFAYVVNLSLAVMVIIWSLPLFVFVAIGIAYVYSKFFIAYTNTARDIRRIESVLRSPIFSSFAELLDGVVSVRAYGEEKRFLINCTKRLDRATAAYWYMWMSSRWLLFRYDIIGAFATFVASLLALSGGISPGIAGIAITQTQSLTASVYWISRFWTALEQDANSVERVVEIITDVPQESAAIIEDSRPPALWPSRGVVSVEGLELRYAPELPAVLREISFETRPNEKVGVVGRTGSGKSTLALAFFRFVEFSKGTIKIDDIDITSFGLDDLRSRLTIIPQDAVLFSGTIRDNLDPFNEHTDDEVIAALHSVQIQTTPPASRIASQPASRIQSRPESPQGQNEGGREPSDSSRAPAQSAPSQLVSSSTQIYLTLETKVSEGGNSLSQGTRQLIAMARALLRSSRLIIMDEASSSIDFHTDAMIQETIRDSFKNATVITIAHRLATVVEYDRVLVLDSGRVAEFDTPANLLSDPNSVFYSMCEKSGDFETLKKVAGKERKVS